jgi:undecaprenyl-phosphate 4-deoxy-4-formamido-L-arabinose transferase
LAAVDRHPGVAKYVKLARNFGEHNAVMCGLSYATGECAAIIDDDFQNPPGEIIKMVKKLAEGFDVVYSYYDKKQHNFFRNLGSSFNNLVATFLLKKPKNLYLSSFKVLNRFLIETITKYQGPYPYIDSLIIRSTASVGKQLCLHQKREVGKSNYTPAKLFKLWLNMFTSLSILPLKVASFLGITMATLGLVLAAFFTISWHIGGIFSHQPVPPGWASLIVSVLLFSGLQFCILGMIGEYLGRMYLIANRTPQYVVRKTWGAEKDRPEN